MTGYELQYISSTNGAFDSVLAANITSTSVVESKFLITSFYTGRPVYFGIDYADTVVRASNKDMYMSGLQLISISSYLTLNEEHTAYFSPTEYRWNGTKIADVTGTVAIPSSPRFRSQIRGNLYYFKITDNGVDRVNLVAWQDGNGNLGLYDKVNDVFYTPSSGTWTAGPRAHIFTIDKSNTRFDATGGTETVEIEAETTWTASTPSFVSVSPSTGDTGTTQVTITCPSYTGETRREDVITFTDNDDYTLTFKARQNGNSAGFSNIYIGDNNLLSNTIYLGDNAVNTIYLGEEIIYSNGPFVGLKVAPQSLVLTNATNAANITIRSSEDWTITDDSGGWLSYSTTTGGTGKTVVTVTASTTQAERTATITVRSANYSATIAVTDVALTMPLDEVWYKTTNNTKETLRSGTYYIDANGNQLTYTETFDSESGLWKMKFNGNVAGNQGSIYYNGSNKLVELWLPYGYVRPDDIFIYGQRNFEKFKGDSQAIVDNGNAVVCLVDYPFQEYGNLQNFVIQAAKKGNTTITIPEGVVGIFSYAFHYTIATTVNLPSTITNVGGYSLESSQITTMNCYATACPTVNSTAFYFVNNSGTLHYPAGSDYSSFTIPNTWTKVGDL